MNFYLTASFLPFPSHFQQVSVVEKLEMMDELEVEALLEVSATHEANDSGEDMRVPPPAPRVPQEEFGFSDGAMSSGSLKAPASMVEEWFPRAGVFEDKEVDGSKGAVSARRHKADARPLPRRRNAFEEPRERSVVVKETMEVETMGAGATAAKGKVQFAQSPLRFSFFKAIADFSSRTDVGEEILFAVWTGNEKKCSFSEAIADPSVLTERNLYGLYITRELAESSCDMERICLTNRRTLQRAV
ncbi:hypothetical protein PUNSTDRAFT_44467 [Punctularia strigosozonata HHB-11173 SS5]|uniref:uncharacterized protein n=1 Tax=Punctularia strigosozonata (strain HHB-11173) TaxID=741275 RepID=UPI00044167C4|nr:uncharacterized protein PUNSTDRAFT_44467 [Punctularia strigosozonata HHB-11173 SS5]EIN08981.1 hypothetical protein PUNSTDRAFT_44467 [Punctularia strigosozonata HHB-11173 SS5]